MSSSCGGCIGWNPILGVISVSATCIKHQSLDARKYQRYGCRPINMICGTIWLHWVFFSAERAKQIWVRWVQTDNTSRESKKYAHDRAVELPWLCRGLQAMYSWLCRRRHAVHRLFQFWWLRHKSRLAVDHPAPHKVKCESGNIIWVDPFHWPQSCGRRGQCWTYSCKSKSKRNKTAWIRKWELCMCPFVFCACRCFIHNAKTHSGTLARSDNIRMQNKSSV